MLRAVPRPLALLLAVSALLTGTWAFTLTPFQGPDEPAHFAYTQYLAETGHRPSVVLGDHPDSTQSGGALALFNLDQLAGVSDARPAWTELEEDRFASLIKTAGEAAEEDGSGPNPLGKNPPLYYAYQVPAYALGSIGSFWDRLIVMRLASALLILAAVAFTWFAAAEVFAATWPRVIATGCVAMLPQLTAIGGTINADNMLIAVWAAFTFAALRVVRRGPTAGRLLAVGAAAAASLLTHGRGIAIVPALLVVVAVALVRARPSLRQAAWWLTPCAAVLAATLVVYRLLLTPDSGGAYGGEVNLASGGSAMSLKGFIGTTWQFYFPRVPGMAPRPGGEYGYRQMFIESFFGRFASLEIGYSPLVYGLIQLAAAIGIVGLVAAVVYRREAVLRRWPQVVVVAAITGSLVGLLHLASYRSLVGTQDPLITGRYLLPLVTVFGLTVAFVVSSLRPRLSAMAGTLALTALLVLNLGGLMLTFARFYG